MALTHHSVRTCLLWRDTPLFGDAPRQSLWDSLLQCLETLQDPGHAGDGNADGPTAVDDAVALFLDQLLDHADDKALAEELRNGLKESRPVEVLLDWYGHDTEAGGDRPGGIVRLFTSALMQALAAYSLGQLAFLFGHLWLAKRYSIAAYNLLQSDRLAGEDEARQAQNLEFLTITLLIEVQFHSQGYDTLRDERNDPYVRGIAQELALAMDADRYLPELPNLEELGLQVRNGKVSGPAQDFVRLWLPVPTDNDTQKLTVTYLRPPGSNPLAVAWVLSRRNRAGMLYYRYRNWHAAEQEFLVVEREARKHQARENPVLVPVSMEAKLYLGRIRSRKYEFAAAEELLGEARRYFEEVQDEFAVNKAMKAEAELLYRRSRLAEAEALFQEVSAASARKGFVHDWASAEMYLAKIESGYGFQATAAQRFARVSAHFSKYDAPRETIECLFWSTAAQGRHLSLQGHPRASVIEARALLKVYRRLFEGVRNAGGELLRKDYDHLREALENKRDPDVTEVMLDLRLGQPPAADLVAKLQERLAGKAQAPARKGNGGGPASRSGDRAKEDRLVAQILRLVTLQQEDGTIDAPAEPDLFPKMDIRDQVLSALEAAARGRTESARGFLGEAQRGIRERGLGGGLVPFLVDLSQFFLHRDSFIALLLVLLDEVDRAIRGNGPAASSDGGRDTETLKDAYRSLTKYLVLERNFYLGPPAFEPENGQPLWRKLRRSYPYGPREWRLHYDRALLGGHGLSYPGNAVGLGWVESVETGSVTLRIAWAEEISGNELRPELFRRLSVPRQVAEQGHSVESMVPVVLIGRQGVGAGEVPWAAHRIPLDLSGLELFRGLEASPWYEPVLASWQPLFDRFNGLVPATCESPVLTAADREAIEARYEELARSWFGGRFRDDVFERIFREKRRQPSGTPAPAYASSPDDEEVRKILESFTVKLSEAPAAPRAELVEA
ncbi:MAG: hypothetical protein ACJ75H_06685 [Thermoanaerobaculia bacterium]